MKFFCRFIGEQPSAHDALQPALLPLPAGDGVCCEHKQRGHAQHGGHPARCRTTAPVSAGHDTSATGPGQAQLENVICLCWYYCGNAATGSTVVAATSGDNSRWFHSTAI